MSKMKSILKNRVLLTILAVAVGWSSLTVLMAGPAYACPPCDVWYHYFTDASHSEECGYKVILAFSCGHAIQSGCQTPYYEIEQVCD